MYITHYTRFTKKKKDNKKFQILLSPSISCFYIQFFIFQDLHYFSDSEHHSVNLGGLMPRQELRRLRNRWNLLAKYFQVCNCCSTQDTFWPGHVETGRASTWAIPLADHRRRRIGPGPTDSLHSNFCKWEGRYHKLCGLQPCRWETYLILMDDTWY